MSAFATLGNVKALLRIPTAVTAWDSALELLLADVDGMLASEAGLPGLTQASYTEDVDVPWPGMNTLPLKAWPVLAVTGLTDDSTAVAATDYAVAGDCGYIRLTADAAYFARGRSIVHVSYSAGLTYTHRLWNTFKRAVREQVAFDFNRAPRMGFSEVASADVRGTLAPGDHLCPAARAAVNSIRRAF